MRYLLAVGCLFAAASVHAAAVTDVRIRAVDGFGGDTSAALSRCQTKVGAEYSDITVTRDVTSLKDSGEFEEINVEKQWSAAGVDVVFYVKRKMRFAGPLTVEGNNELGESTISKESGLKDGYLYGEADFAAAAAKVRLAYQKKYYSDATVIYKTKLIGGNDVNVTFVINEGLRAKVDSYLFEGAEHAIDVSAWRAMMPGYELGTEFIDLADLHRAIEDYPWWNPIGWFSDNPVTRDQQAQCCEKVAKVYRDHGYLDVRVTGPDRVPSEDGKVNVVFHVAEGVQYFIGTSSVKGVTRYKEEDVIERSKLPEAGVVASEEKLNDAAHRVEVTVGSGDSGLADTRVAVQRIPTENPNTVNIVYKVSEGVPVVINEVKIRGNDYTMDKVIRREIALGPGDRMLADRAERSQKRLENLDYFSRVRYYLEPTDKGKDANGAEYRDLVYEVEEKNTGAFMVGVGASTVDSVFITAEVSQNNFDLFAPSKLFRGAGQKGRVSVAWGPRYQSAEVGIVEPHLFNRLLELSVDLYRRMRWYDQYDLYRTGAMASLAYPVKFWPTWEPFGRLGIGLSGEFIEFDEVDSGWYDLNGRSCQAFREEERQYGDAFEPVIQLFWLKDSRDNFRIPKSGHYTKVFGNVAPACDNQYWRIGVRHRSYFDVWKRFDHIFMAGLRAETIDSFSDDLPIYDRMFLGGPRSIRGIRYRNVSPMIKRTYGNDYAPWGGQTLFCMNFEYTIPIVSMLRFAIFSDLGSVGEDTFDFDFADTFAWTVGLGLRLDLPMFPIRLDFATPLKTPDEAEEEIFSFLIGYDF